MLMDKRIVSGMRPTGKLHLGHYLGVIQNWVELQSKYESFFFVADWHALTTKYDKTENLKNDVVDVVIDWLASGIDPKISTIYVQSLVPEIAELNIYLGMVTPQNWVERDPTLKDMAKILRTKEGANSQISYGLMGYPVLMSADIMMFNANAVPVGIDGNKMGKSFQNDIKISDTAEVTSKKIMSAITDRSRMRKDDPGHPDDCEVAFKYWQIFGSEEQVQSVRCECEKGLRGCADCKRQLGCAINERFAEIREKRAYYEAHPEIVREIIQQGSAHARVEARKVLDEVRNLINMY